MIQAIIWALFLALLSFLGSALDGINTILFSMFIGCFGFVGIYLEKKRWRGLAWDDIRQWFPPPLTLEVGNIRNLGFMVSRQWIELDRIQSALDVIREGVLAIDQNGILVISNPSAQKIFDWNDSQLGIEIKNLKFSKILKKAIKSALNGESFLGIWKVGPKPSRKYYEITAIPWEDERGCVLVIRDITRLRKLERVRRDFVANISHELRTPISIVRANAETLIDGAVDDPVYGPRFLNAILRHGERLSQIVNELLEISRLEAGEYNVNLQKIAIYSLILKIAEGMEEKATAKNIDITIDIPLDLDVQADENALHHIVSNYLDNAIKYTPNNGSVTIYTKEENDKMYLMFEDNGVGVAAKHRPRVFERFYRVDKGRSRTVGGTGLGLSVVRHFAEVMGEEVGMKPAVPNGSIFWCTLSQDGQTEPLITNETV